MPLPVTFATLAGGNQPLSLFDTQSAAIAALGAIPCACSGQNSLVLTPVANTPTLSSYVDLQPSFVFVASQTNTTAVTANINLLGSRNVYKYNAINSLLPGDIQAGGIYRLTPLQALNLGAGGFNIDTISVSPLQSGVEFLISGGGSAITAGLKGFLTLPFSAVITNWTIVADQSGSISIDLWRANAAVPNSGNSIVGSGTKPNLTSSQFATGVPTSWTSTTLNFGDVLGFDVASSVTVTQVTVSLALLKL